MLWPRIGSDKSPPRSREEERMGSEGYRSVLMICGDYMEDYEVESCHDLNEFRPPFMVNSGN
jgi:hypothetical protein